MSDGRMQRGQEWLERLLPLMGVSTDVQAQMGANAGDRGDLSEPDSYWLTINEKNLQPEQIQILIGPDGTVLDAIQYLANATLNVNQTQDQQAAYTIELDGYRIRRQAEIQEIARATIEQVRATSQEVEIKSLSSAERRQIHTFLKDYPDLETFSRGKEPHRHLVIRPMTAQS